MDINTDTTCNPSTNDVPTDPQNQTRSGASTKRDPQTETERGAKLEAAERESVHDEREDVESYVAPLGTPGLFAADPLSGGHLPGLLAEQAMACPCCGEEIGVHAVSVALVPRPEDRLSPLHTRYGYPFDFTSGGAIVDFEGECGCSFALVFSNHDGTMFAGWFAAGEDREAMEHRAQRASEPRPTSKQMRYLKELAARAGLLDFMPLDMTRSEAGEAIADLLDGRLPEFAQGWGLPFDFSLAGGAGIPDSLEPIDDEQARRDRVARVQELEVLGVPKNDATGLFIKELLPNKLASKYRTKNQWHLARGTVRPGALPVEMHAQKLHRKATKEYFHIDDVVFDES